jgi:hypothetical protein
MFLEKWQVSYNKVNLKYWLSLKANVHSVAISSIRKLAQHEKDWVIKRYPSKKKEVEEYVNNSKYIKVVADLANALKHGGLDRKSRSDAEQTDYYGKVTLNNKTSRFMYYIKVDGNVVELFNILRGAIDEYEAFDTKQMLIEHDKSRVTNT